jgi:hypothetical protein
MTSADDSPLAVECPDCGALPGCECRSLTHRRRSLVRGCHSARCQLRNEHLYRTAPGKPAVVNLDGWAGRTQVRVTVLGETPQRYRVRYEEDAGYSRGARQGSVKLVPKYAVTFQVTP